MEWLFYGCSNLTGTIRIENNLTIDDYYSYYYCFNDAATEPGCQVTLVGNGSNTDFLNRLVGTKTASSNVRVGP